MVIISRRKQTKAEKQVHKKCRNAEAFTAGDLIQIAVPYLDGKVEYYHLGEPAATIDEAYVNARAFIDRPECVIPIDPNEELVRRRFPSVTISVCVMESHPVQYGVRIMHDGEDIGRGCAKTEIQAEHDAWACAATYTGGMNLRAKPATSSS